jgi:hypothetical protein
LEKNAAIRKFDWKGVFTVSQYGSGKKTCSEIKENESQLEQSSLNVTVLKQMIVGHVRGNDILMI